MEKIHISALLGFFVVFLFILAVATAQDAVAAELETQQEKPESAVVGQQSQTVGEFIDDSVVTTAVKAKIFEEKGLSSYDIHVKTKDGIVTLSGKTNTVENSQLTERVAKLVKGVKEVVNELQIDGKISQSAGEYIDDSTITTSVKADILREKGLASLSISVKTLDGVVTLSGKTNTIEHSQLAERVTKLVKGVKEVVNELQVDDKTRQSAREYFDDSTITTAVKADILREKGLSSLGISVKTKDGVVALSGKTSTLEHAQLAERVATQVKGVKQVVNELKVK